jgi:hypothetical protein
MEYFRRTVASKSMAQIEGGKTMTTKSGMWRPGALQMLAALILGIICSAGPVVLAMTRPTHEWSLIAVGPEALLLSSLGLIIVALYAIGCIRYCASKGYSKWLGFWLFLSHLTGFVTLLLLPDLYERSKRNAQNDVYSSSTAA